MVTGTLVKFEPLKTGEVTVTISCGKDVNLHHIVDMLGKNVSIALPSTCNVQDSKVTLLCNMRDQMERMLEFINFEMTHTDPIVVNAIAASDDCLSVQMPEVIYAG